MPKKSFKDLRNQRTSRAQWLYDPTADARSAPLPSSPTRPVTTPPNTTSSEVQPSAQSSADQSKTASVPTQTSCAEPTSTSELRLSAQSSPAPSSVQPTPTPPSLATPSADSPAIAASLEKEPRPSASLSKAPPPAAPPSVTPTPATLPSNFQPSTTTPSSSNQSSSSHCTSTLPYRLPCNSDVEVRQTKKKGRGLFWAPSDDRTLHKGEVLMQVQPYSLTLLTDMLPVVCAGCFTRFTVRSCTPCTGCQTVVYCSAQCRKADAADHELECSALRTFVARGQEAIQRVQRDDVDVPALDGDPSLVPKETVRGMARLLFQRQRLVQQGRWQAITDLSNPRSNLPLEEQASLGKTASQLAYFLECAHPNLDIRSVLARYGVPTPKHLLDFAAQYQSNAFAALDTKAATLGTAVAPEPALMNHDCLPNTVWGYPRGTKPRVDDEQTQGCLVVTCTQDVPPGQELTTSYLSSTTPLHLRDKILANTYGFRCTCLVCRRGRQTVLAAQEALYHGTLLPLFEPGSTSRRLWHDPRDALRCLRPECTGWIMVPWMNQNELDGLKRKRAGQVILWAECPQCKVALRWDYGAAQQQRLEGDRVLHACRTQGVPARELQASIFALQALLPITAYPLQDLVSQVPTSQPLA